MEVLLIGLFRALALIISCVVWGVVGLFVWVGLLIRHFFVFSALSILAAFGGGGQANAIENMTEAVRFYPNGFVRIFESLANAGTPGEGELWGPTWRFILEAYSAAIFFWAPIALVTGWLAIDNYMDFLLAPFTLLWMAVGPFVGSLLTTIRDLLP